MLATPIVILLFVGNDWDQNRIGASDNPLDNAHCGAVPTQQPPMQPLQQLGGPTASGGGGLQTRMMIVGGMEAQVDAWPWQIAVLDRRKRLICGGTLITSEFILTAAHCVTKQMNMNIVAGEYNLAYKDGEDRQERRVARAFKHPQYNMNNVDNDIALLKLESPLQLTQRVWPACLPQQGEELEPEVNATILGWGATRYLRQADGKPRVERDDMLHEARVPVVDFGECKQSYGDDLETHHVVCAGYKEGRIDSCAGDSGGPLLVERDNRWHVYGVTSFGDECGKEGKYGIYSKTSAYTDWIRKIVSKHTTSRTSL